MSSKKRGTFGFGNLRVAFDQTILNPNNAMRMPGNILFVGNNDNRIALLVKFAKQSHNLLARFRIEVPGRLVSKNDRGAGAARKTRLTPSQRCWMCSEFPRQR